jgi:glycosyltransferase involved in cell wall biosynthesis
MTSFISIILPCFNEEQDLPRCLTSLENQTYEHFEIIAINDGSTDNTGTILQDYAERHPNVVIVEIEHKNRKLGSGAPRNEGAKYAKGDILVFVDADVTLEPDYLHKITVDIRNGNAIGTMYGYEENANYDKNCWARCFGRVRWDAFEEGYTVYPVFSAILKSVFDEVGGFDASRAYGSDHTIHIKSGLQAKVVKATSYHYNPDSISGIYKHAVWFGRGIPQRIKVKKIADRVGDPTLRWQLKLLTLTIILLCFLVIVISWKIGPIYAILFLLIFFISYLLLRGISMAIQERDLRLMMIFPVFLLTKYIAHCHGFLSYLITKEVAPVR